MNYIDQIEDLLFKYWEELPEGKETYTMWFYRYRKGVVQWLFSQMVEMPERNEK